jgi:hypothetical protein
MAQKPPVMVPDRLLSRVLGGVVLVATDRSCHVNIAGVLSGSHSGCAGVGAAR